MTDEGVRQATKAAVLEAKSRGLRRFDPNLRPPLWRTLEDAREQIGWGLGHCDILKISDNEIQWLTGEESYTEGVKKIRREFAIPLILVSMGKDGSRAYYQEEERDWDYRRSQAVSPGKYSRNNRGRRYVLCLCTELHFGSSDGRADGGNFQEMLTFANAAASLITTRKGALRVMPSERRK